VGLTAIGPDEWLARQGSVGRAVHGRLHICGEDGQELPKGSVGEVFFESPTSFEYHNDPDRTAQSRNGQGWTTLGDLGWLDEDGYLYLTDRKSFMIISGGVNISPQEIENHLVGHPKVADVAVVGAPHEEMGEQVVAVVQLVPGLEPGPDLTAELEGYCRATLSSLKIPRRFDYVSELPREANGKLYKRLLRDGYWASAGS
jgi:acyl-CoA synthetase (AMP-forming)/AMP-acid ligase II